MSANPPQLNAQLEVDPTVTTTPVTGLFDRVYKIAVTFFNDQSVNLSDSRCTFKFKKNISRTMQFGSVTIYNLSGTTETDLFKNAKMITVEAGYRNGAYGVVFQGFVRQPIRGKENATDSFITLGAIDGDNAMNLAFVSAYVGAGQLPNEIANQVVRASNVPFELQIRGDLGGQRTERAKVLFGQPKEILQQLSTNADAALYSTGGTTTMSTVSQEPPPIVPELNYQTGMIGMPRQQDNGIQVRSLLRPDFIVDSWVKLNNKNIILEPTEFGERLNQYVIDLDGVYRIIEIEATGDTRGNEWYYDLTLLSQNGALPAIAGLSGQFGF